MVLFFLEFFKIQAENSYQMYLSNDNDDDKEDIDLEAHI